jgi:hypothetical protein
MWFGNTQIFKRYKQNKKQYRTMGQAWARLAMGQSAPQPQITRVPTFSGCMTEEVSIAEVLAGIRYGNGTVTMLEWVVFVWHRRLLIKKRLVLLLHESRVCTVF